MAESSIIKDVRKIISLRDNSFRNNEVIPDTVSVDLAVDYVNRRFTVDFGTLNEREKLLLNLVKKALSIGFDELSCPDNDDDLSNVSTT